MASVALPLQAYLATTRGPASVTPKALPARPEGPLVWAWASDAMRGRALASLCTRLRHLSPDLSVMLSGKAPDNGALPHLDAPPERLADCTIFARHIAPDVVLWAGDTLHPALLYAFAETGAHLIALDLPETLPTALGAPRWLPDPVPATLPLFHRLHTATETGARRLRRQGLPGDRVRASGPLRGTDLPLTCDETTYQEVSSALTGRPVWLAARLHAPEVAAAFSAHRQAVRLNHRLLLVMVPADDEAADAMQAQARDTALRMCHWDTGETPDENTQVILTEGPEELGLWYRVAPLAFLGGSLSAGIGGEDPYQAAALGTAILYGPNVGLHLNAYSQLVEAGAARIVRDADSLASAVLHLVAPDQAATMAHAGWDVVTSGAQLIDAVIAEVTEVLEAPGARNAAQDATNTTLDANRDTAPTSGAAS